MKALELLKDYKNIDFGCNVEELHNEIDEAISELEEIKSCVFVGQGEQSLDSKPHYFVSFIAYSVKMRVTPELSEKVQKICFKNGLGWAGVRDIVSFTKYPYLYIYTNDVIRYGEDEAYFVESSLPEVIAEDFILTDGTMGFRKHSTKEYTHDKILEIIEPTSSSDDEKTTKVEKKKIGREELVVRTKIDSLLEVYNDLGTMKWTGADEIWDNAIEAVRKNLFSKIKKSLRKTDRVDLEYPVAIYYKD